MSGSIDWREVARLAGPHKLWLAIALMIAVALTEGVGIVMLVPLIGALDIGQGAALPAFGAWFDSVSLPMLLTAFVILVSLRALALYARAIQGRLLEIAVVDGLRARAFSALLDADWRALSRMRQSETRALLITSVDRVGYAVDRGLASLAVGVNFAFLAVAAFIIAPLLAIGVTLSAALVLLLYRGFRSRARSLGEELGRAYEAIYARLEENLGALRLIKSFEREEAARAGVSASFAELRRQQLAYERDAGRARVALQIGAATLLAILVALAVVQWNMSPALLLPVAAIFVRSVPLVGALQEAWQQYLHAAPAWGELETLIAKADAAREGQGSTFTPPVLERELRFDALSFSHREGRAALRSIDFSITAGSFVAVTGASGSGKSTLADIAGGLLMPDHGALVIDGQALGPGDARAWRRQVAYMQQEPLLFGGTIRDNLAFADQEASDTQLWAALEMAGASFVAGLDDGLDATLGELGTGLSGGERQRLALARCLLRNPSLLILDEATSALDIETEQKIAATLADLAGPTTILALTHRMSLVEHAQHHFVLEAGRIAAIDLPQ